MAYSILFPGQGSQFVGMGADLFAARPDLLGADADEALGGSLRDLCLEGPDEELVRTDRAQPALFALAYVLWEELAGAVTDAGIPGPAAAAGHSLGEYTALAAAGAFDFATGLRLVAARGLAMAAAANAEASGMAALLGVDGEAAESVARKRRDQGGRLWVANINAPGQVVLAGGQADIDWVIDNGRDLGVRRVVPLKVAGAFHTPFMASAAQEYAASVAAVDIAQPRFTVHGNAEAAPMTGDIGALLIRQLTSPVRFAESLESIAASGVDTFVHVGPGEVTAGMAKRTVPGARVLTVSGLEDVAPTVEDIGSPHTMARPEGEN